MTPSIGVITPGAGETVSALLPAEMTRAPSEWEWYHRCLSAVGTVSYFGLSDWEGVSGCDAVLVHEAFELVTRGATVGALTRLRNANRRLIWVEPHERSTFGAPVFEPGFFDAVDTVAKYQLMDYDALIRGLRAADNNLAPWALYGHSSIDTFYGDPRLFAVPTSPETLAQHLAGDLGDGYGDQIVPMMRLFTFTGPDSHYARQPPSRQPRIMKESQLGIVAGGGPAGSLRGVLAGLLAQSGLEVKLHTSRLRAAATCEAFAAIGPVSVDAGAADVLRFDTLAILPDDQRYLVWDDVFQPYESYLPLTAFGELLRDGGRRIDGRAARRITDRLRDDLADASLRARILDGQRQAYDLLRDANFVTAKLGIDAPRPVLEAARAPELRTGPAPEAPPPVQIGSISTDEVSVVIQGPIGALADQVLDSVRRHLPGAEVVVSTWEGERALGSDVERRIESADPGAPWFIHDDYANNTVRLHVSTCAGLAACTRPYALKLRSDTPLSGTRFLEVFQRYPARSEALRLLRDRIVVINHYCYDPQTQPHGLFFVADTVQFGRTEDLRDAWDRPPDDEPANTVWFENHRRPEPDLLASTHFRFAAEQLFWLGLLRKHIDVPFEHLCDRRPENWLLHERSIANNLVIVDPDEFCVEVPSFAARPPQPGAVYTEPTWRRLYERHCLSEGKADPLHGARPFVVLAEAEQLLAGDDMLRAYADAMSGSVLATLAIDASAVPPESAAAALHDLVERCGLSLREDIDLLAIVGASDHDRRARIRSGTHALYRRELADDGERPVFTPESLGELRAFAERLNGSPQ